MVRTATQLEITWTRILFTELQAIRFIRSTFQIWGFHHTSKKIYHRLSSSLHSSKTKRFREKNREIYPKDIFLCRRSAVWHEANLCPPLRKEISSAGRACGANICPTPAGESQKNIYFSCCTTRQYRRGTNSSQSPPTNLRNISAVAAEHAALWHKANMSPTPPTNISSRASTRLVVSRENEEVRVRSLLKSE